MTTDIKKLMEEQEDGTEVQFYPETHPEAILGLEGYLNQNVTSGVSSVNGKKGAVIITADDLGIQQGVKGDKGDKGDTGEKGVQGLQGMKGDKGDAGTTTANATETTAGLMSSQDKKKLNSVPVIRFVKVGEVK